MSQPTNTADLPILSRRRMLRILAAATAGISFAPVVVGQGYCRDGYETKACPLPSEVATAPIKPVFAPTGWQTTAIDHLSFQVADYRKEAAFYAALLGWTLRSDDGTQAILDIGDWASVIFKQASPGFLQKEPASSDGSPVHAVVDSIGFVIAPWNAKEIGVQLRKRGLAAVAENDAHGFESYRTKDPDGFDLQICNGNGLARDRRTKLAHETPSSPFAPTGWKTVWLDHISFRVTNYKESASFYCNLLGWKPTYDEGSQIECLMGDVGNIIIRGGNAFDPKVKNSQQPRHAIIDHISFGIEPWDTDRVKAELEKRGLPARVDTAQSGEIHVASYKSYHTETPNGYNLQISPITRQSRLTLSQAVKPKRPEERR